MKTSDFDYHLPSELIAQTPIITRDQSRLLVLNKQDGTIEHRQFTAITEYLKSGDVLVFNNSRVIPARLKGIRVDTGGSVELLLLRKLDNGTWQTLVKPGKRIRQGTIIEVTNAKTGNTITAEAVDFGEGGTRIIKFSDNNLLRDLGEVPLPPYIHTHLDDPERYQTVYADPEGSAAAPTAGLHFTPELILEISDKGVKCLFTTLHIGLDTFRPVKEKDPREHVIHSEFGILDDETASEISKAKSEKRRIICVGTTSVRLVEAAAQNSNDDKIKPYEGWVNLYILPGYQFKITDAMITNFHLPRSTLVMMVSALAGTENIKKAYKEAVENRYRFYSFGDAMLIL
ncbi:MAG: tRNA preQ1(34) S-adenosylmethionine ribosyltransferase-isomerase QueA [Dehalococcoidales bacterium]|nr:MAG: tRNA preQ1(34) S-adenosylmethionine ribosyltransferase-isomerase QueA [Dehalococcoidales bacterium]